MSGPGGLGAGVALGPPDAGGRYAGVQREIRLDPPAPGADWTFQVPAGTWCRPILARARLVTSAAVANRVPVLTLADGDALAVWQCAPQAAQAATATVDYSAADSGAGPSAVLGGVAILPLPSVWLPAGWSVRIVTAAIDAADQWSAIRLVIAELDRGPYGEQVGIDPTSSY